MKDPIMSCSPRNFNLYLLAFCCSLFLGSCDDDAPGEPPLSGVQIPSGAVAWLPAEGNATDVMSGRLGTVQGSSCFGSGKVAQGFRFDANWSACVLPDTTTLDMRSSLSLLFWTKLDTPLALQPVTAYYSDYPFLVSKGNGDYSKRNYGIYFNKPANRLYFNGINALGTDYIFSAVLDSASQYFDELGWHLVGAVWDRPTRKAHIFIDGQIVATADGIDADLGINDHSLMIGAGYVDQFFIKASIDEVMVFSRALSATDIQRVYNAGATGCVK